MTRLSFEQYLGHLETESRRFRDVLADCDPRARVPSCPDWNAADLLWHLGAEVQDFWAWVVTNRPKHPREGHQEPTRPSSYDELLALFDDRSAALVSALRDADPADEAWTWASEQTVGFTFRRQAHEALIHRVDAELAAGATPAPIDPALATDGVDEVLAVMYGGGPAWGTFSGLPHWIRVDVTDTGESVWVQLGHFSGTDPDDGTVYDEEDIAAVDAPGVEPDAVISAPSDVLLLRFWRRGDGADIHLAGNLEIVDRFRRVIHQPIT
ncbi:maleylpyruvate isomerase family mycothiol-dependent enzyme [Nocardioides sp. GXQ0305]|uniref:maleylpyruvate isomerase family mycothiol-dependent enzyme n=1 Tax=Nocardioides sp. GXQ0305 TaxID=3423912 RepID=UPI003D7C4768